MNKEQLQQVRDALAYYGHASVSRHATTEALRIIDAELAKPEPEHAATITRFPAGDYVMVKAKLTLPAYELPDGTLLYTAPVATPQRKWQGLTKDEINNCASAEIYPSTWAMAFARAIETALKAKNTKEQP